MARTKHIAAGKPATAAKRRRLHLRVSQCGKAKNKRFPYSSLTMRRSLGAYRHSAVADNATRLSVVRHQYALAEPSRAKRAQLCRYVVMLRRRPSPGSQAHSLRGYLKRREPAKRTKLPSCKLSSRACGMTCIPLARRCARDEDLLM